MVYDHIRESADFIQQEIQGIPRLAFMTGTGLKDVFQDVKVIKDTPFRDIPHLVTPSVTSHGGSLIYGIWHDVPCFVITGRLHTYEGHDISTVVQLPRALRMLGVSDFILTNVSGGIHGAYSAGDLTLVRDHIFLQGKSPLEGDNDDRLGPRFPDLSAVYDVSLRELLQQAALAAGQNSLHEGVYACLRGPQLETPAEYRYLSIIGADMVGMSTVPEVIALKHMGACIAVLSLISNECHPSSAIQPTTLSSVLDVAQQAIPRIKDILNYFVKNYAAKFY